MDSSSGDNFRYAVLSEAIEGRGADLKLGNLLTDEGWYWLGCRHKTRPKYCEDRTASCRALTPWHLHTIVFSTVPERDQ